MPTHRSPLVNDIGRVLEPHRPRARDQLQRLHVGTFTGPAGLFRQTTPASPETRRLHTALALPLPPRILDLDPEHSATR